jgi:hypothetical protein
MLRADPDATLREMIRKALDGTLITELFEPEDPVHVNAVIDPQAAQTDRHDTKFLPTNGVEFQVAIQQLVKAYPQADFGDVLKVIKATLEKAQEQKPDRGDRKMNKQQAAEALIRKRVRQIIREAMAADDPRRRAGSKKLPPGYAEHLPDDVRAAGLKSPGSITAHLPDDVKNDLAKVRKGLEGMADEDTDALKRVAAAGKNVRGSKVNDEQAQQIIAALGDEDLGMSQFMNLDKATKMRFFVIMYLTNKDRSFFQRCVEDYVAELEDQWTTANQQEAGDDKALLTQLNQEMMDGIDEIEDAISQNPGVSEGFSDFVQKEVTDTINEMSPEQWKDLVDRAKKGFEGVPGGVSPENIENLRTWISRRGNWLKPGGPLDRSRPIPPAAITDPAPASSRAPASTPAPAGAAVEQDDMMSDDDFKAFTNDLAWDKRRNTVMAARGRKK